MQKGASLKQVWGRLVKVSYFETILSYAVSMNNLVTRP